MTAERQLRFWLVGTGLFLVALYFLRGILLPFVAGMAIAYFLDPVCDWLERRGCSRTLATALVTLAFLVIAIGALFLLLPPLERQIVQFAVAVPGYVEAALQRLAPLMDLLRERFPQLGSDQLGGFSSQVGSVLRWVGNAIGRLLSSSLALANILSLVFITPIVTFYLLRDWDRMVRQIDGWLPQRHAATIRTQMTAIDRTLAGFARGQASVCLFLAVFYGGGLTLIGLDFGLALGLIAGALSFIPYVGSAVGLIGSMALALAQFDSWTMIGLVLALFVVGQVIEGNILTPKLVGDRVGLHPVWVIFALLAGGSLFGFLGLLLAVPAAAVIGVLVRFSLTHYLASPLYLGLSPPEDRRRSPGSSDDDAGDGGR